MQGFTYPAESTGQLQAWCRELHTYVSNEWAPGSYSTGAEICGEDVHCRADGQCERRDAR